MRRRINQVPCSLAGPVERRGYARPDRGHGKRGAKGGMGHEPTGGQKGQDQPLRSLGTAASGGTGCSVWAPAGRYSSDENPSHSARRAVGNGGRIAPNPAAQPGGSGKPEANRTGAVRGPPRAPWRVGLREGLCRRRAARFTVQVEFCCLKPRNLYRRRWRFHSCGRDSSATSSRC